MIRIIITVLVYLSVGFCAILIPTSITHGTPAFGMDCSSYQTCCVVGSVMLYIKRTITAQHTMCGGG